jgi:HrpA-like RNA helicase
VAETSLKIPAVTVVINSGQVKKDFCDAVTGIVNIKLIDTSKASDMQRAGRAGRVQPGVCYHCFTKQDYNKHSDYDVPAIQRANLSQALMVMASVGISDFENFPLLNKPDSKQVESAKKALVSIGALDSLMALTDYGQQIADFPLIPELAHLLVQAAKEDAVVEMATFLAMIESRPIPKKSKDGIPKYLSVTGDCKSDPEVYLKLWQEYHEANFSWDWAKDQGLNPKRMQEARDVRGQLLQIASEQGLPIDSTKDGFSKLKRALLKARPDQICIQGMSHDYQSLMGKLEDIYIHPSSVTFSGFSSPRLLWYFKAQTTTKLYAHSCMAVNPDELQEFFPEKVETVTKYSPSLFSNNLRIHEEVTFEGRILEQGSSEEREMSPEECDLFSSPGVNRYRSFTSEEIKGLMERRRLTLLEQEEIRERLDKEQAKYLERRREEEAKFRQVQEKRYQVAQTLLTTLPEVPEDAWDLKVMAATIVSGLKSEYVNDRFLEEAPNRIADLQHFCEEHIRSSREYQEKLAFCQEYFEALVDDDLGKCPICYSVGIGQTNTCACVASMSDEQLGLSNGHREIDLISLQTEEGQILARIYIDRPITGLKSIRREVKDLTSLFKDLQVVKSKKD